MTCTAAAAVLLLLLLTCYCCACCCWAWYVLLWQPLLSAGKGRLKQRDTESGQLLLDLVTHADVAEWALWINSFGEQIYNAVWGDKDTYALAFAVAGKAHRFTQVQVQQSPQQSAAVTA
jgi:hypothetical protein